MTYRPKALRRFFHASGEILALALAGACSLLAEASALNTHQWEVSRGGAQS
jgi:hypothetical protein